MLRARHVAIAWLASRVALVGFVALASYLVGFDRAQRWQSFPAWLMGRFSWADSYHYLRIAQKGYLPPGLECCDQAFFPGYPLAIRAVAPLAGGNLTLAGLIVAWAGATAAAVLLWRLATDAAGPWAGGMAVVLLAVAPYGVFLTSVFTESLFLALALGGWLAGLRRHWWWAGALAGLATLVRINGLFLAAALAVMYLLQLRADGRATGHALARPRPDVLALTAPALAVGGYFAYLHALTGSWTAWTDAQTIGWKRENAWPWQGLAAGWRAMTGARNPDLAVAYTADFVACLFGLALLVALLWWRRWPEATFIALNLVVLYSSTTLQSAPRYALTWFPAYLLAAEAVARLRARSPSAAAGAALGAVLLLLPVMGAVAIALAAHLWVA